MGRCGFWACAVLLSVSSGYAQTPQKRSGAVSRIDYSKQIQRLLQYEQHFQNVADRVAEPWWMHSMNRNKAPVESSSPVQTSLRLRARR